MAAQSQQQQSPQAVMIGVFANKSPSSCSDPKQNKGLAQSTLLPMHKLALAAAPPPSAATSAAQRRRKEQNKTVYSANAMLPQDALVNGNTCVTLLNVPVQDALSVVEFQHKANTLLHVENAACSPIFQSMPFINLKMQILHAFAETAQPPSDDLVAFTGIGYVVRYSPLPQPPSLTLERFFPGTREFDDSERAQAEDSAPSQDIQIDASRKRRLFSFV